ncbi:MAG: right-handed parallel beta-helix repeat-containing protein, partial [Candidatus Margulisiibacteriota bacterium]
MKTGLFIASVFLYLLFSSLPALATVYYVDPSSGNNGNTGLSEGQAWRTVTYAVANSALGDTLRMMAGTYDAANGESFPISVATRRYFQKWGSGTPQIDAAYGTNSNLFNVSGSGTTFEGLSIRHNGSNDYSTYSLVSITTSNCLIDSCSFEGAYYTQQVYFSSTSALNNTVRNSSFYGFNSAYYGINFYLGYSSNCNNVVDGCRFTGAFNQAIYAYWYNYGLIIRNNNFTSSGACVYLYYYNNNAVIKNNTFASPSTAINITYYNYNYDISENTL